MINEFLETKEYYIKFGQNKHVYDGFNKAWLLISEEGTFLQAGSILSIQSAQELNSNSYIEHNDSCIRLVKDILVKDAEAAKELVFGGDLPVRSVWKHIFYDEALEAS